TAPADPLLFPLTVNDCSLYNFLMPSISQDETLKARIAEIARFHRDRGRMPSFSELGELVGVRSKNAVYKLVAKLEGLKVLSKDERGRLIPRSLAAPVKVLGT